jgi:hypothetical protein
VIVQMVRWRSATVKATVALVGFASLLVASGAGMRWGDALSLIWGLF